MRDHTHLLDDRTRKEDGEEEEEEEAEDEPVVLLAGSRAGVSLQVALAVLGSSDEELAGWEDADGPLGKLAAAFGIEMPAEAGSDSDEEEEEDGEEEEEEGEEDAPELASIGGSDSEEDEEGLDLLLGPEGPELGPRAVAELIPVVRRRPVPQGLCRQLCPVLREIPVSFGPGGVWSRWERRRRRCSWRPSSCGRVGTQTGQGARARRQRPSRRANNGGISPRPGKLLCAQLTGRLVSRQELLRRPVRSNSDVAARGAMLLRVTELEILDAAAAACRDAMPSSSRQPKKNKRGSETAPAEPSRKSRRS